MYLFVVLYVLRIFHKWGVLSVFHTTLSVVVFDMLTRGTTIWKHATLYSSPHLLILTPPSTHLKGNTQTKTKINTKTKWKYSTEYATPYFSSSTSNYSESIFKLNQSSNVLKSFPTIQTYQRKCEYQRSGSLHCWNAPLTSGEFLFTFKVTVTKKIIL